VAVKALQQRVRFLGWVAEKKELRRYRNACEVLVMPSLYEGLPIAVTEAMACGRPVVATNVNGIPDQIRDGINGLLVPPCDTAGLAAAMKRLLDNPDLGNRLGLASRAIFESEFSSDVVGPKLWAILGDLVQRGDH